MVTIKFIAVGALMIPSSEGKSCTDYLGGCVNDAECAPKCSAKHPGGRGYCYAPIPVFKTCYCNYQCGPSERQPEPKRNCNAGLGPCSRKSCGDSCCNSKCAAKYNNGIGFCDNSAGAVSLCQCKYVCN